MRKRMLRLLVAGLLVALAAAASADTLTVRQDGSGDFQTISAAVAAALAGDLIDIGPGNYAEEVVVTKSIDLLGSAGAALTVIDGDAGHRPLRFSGAIVASVEGVTCNNGTGDDASGGGLRVEGGASVTSRACVLSNNSVTFDGGGFFVWQASQLTLIDCEIWGNTALNNGAAGEVIQGSYVSLVGCVVRDNDCGLRSAGVGVDHSTLHVSGCLFRDNSSVDITGGLYYYLSYGSITGSTFYRNSSPGANGGTVTIQQSPSVSVERCIFAEDLTGVGVEYFEQSGGPRACNLYWANAEGPIQGDALQSDEFIADPLFCNPAAGIFGISSISTAAPAHNDCGVLIGAFPVSCGPTAVTTASWGAVKSLY